MAFVLGLGLIFVSCAGIRGVTSAEEYYSLGMAYFELGKWEEAEKWLNRARMVDKTKVASEYNLGRIAFERGRYDEALRLFNRILAKDPQNILALKAAAYTRIKTGALKEAETLYEQVLALIPESADDGYNYALLLFAMKKEDEAEAVLLKYPYSLDDNSAAILLLARSQGARDKVEAADNYAKWLQSNSDPKVRYEYAQVLEKGEFYARALEEYRTVLEEITKEGSSAAARSKGPERFTVRYAIARLLLIADPENEEGITGLNQAVTEGFTDIAAMESLLDDERIGKAQKDDVRKLIGEMRDAEERKNKAEPVTLEDNASPEESKTDVEGSANRTGE